MAHRRGIGAFRARQRSMPQQPQERRAQPQAGVEWPEPRLRVLQVEEIYRFAPAATAFSFFGAILVLGVLI
jgi:hypothetical protein